MMSVEGPFLAALIARMADPKYNLAAYGVAFSFALIIEAPIIMIMSASTALAKDRESFRKLRNFTFSLNFLLTGIMLIVLLPPVFDFFAITLINLPPNVAKLTHLATMLMIPWPGMIGYRRFYQGILIRSNLTKRVAYGTIIRLTSMGATGLLLYGFFDVSGVVVGAASLSMGVIAEGIASKIMAFNAVKNLNEKETGGNEENISYREIIKFYYPLALTSMLALGAHPIVTFFVGQSRMAIESLAVLPVINSLVFIFRSVGLSFQEVVITLIGEKGSGYKALRNFALIMGVTVVVLLNLIAHTPFAEFWFHIVSGLSVELTDFAKMPLMIIAIMPGLTFLISFQRGLLVYARKTTPITIATAIEVSGIIIVLMIGINIISLYGAVAAVSAYVLGRICANIYLFVPYFKAVKRIVHKV